MNSTTTAKHRQTPTARLPKELGTSIEGERLFTKGELCRCLGWHKRAWLKARRQGLTIHTFAGKACVLGRDAIQFVISRQSAGGNDE